jgi:hypothetical protein
VHLLSKKGGFRFVLGTICQGIEQRTVREKSRFVNGFACRSVPLNVDFVTKIRYFGSIKAIRRMTFCPAR